MPAKTRTKLDNNSDFSATRASLLKARHLPGYIYTSPEVYEMEIEKIFMKDWLCVGRVEEYKNAGDYNAMRIAGEPLLICRDEDGNLNAFANVCQHRGVEVATGQGNAKEFMCPYHAWLYDLKGNLTGAPYSKEVEGFDFKRCRLPRLKLDTWAGWIFVNFDSESEGLGDYLDVDNVRDFAAFLRQEDTWCADKYTFEVDCNWKFIVENLMDMYHVGVIHGASFGKHFPVSDFDYRLTKNGYHAEYQSCTMAPDGISLFGPMPWMDDSCAPWMKGKGVGHNHQYFACTVFVRPTMNIFGRHDMIQPWTYFPMAPDKTAVTIYTQFPKQNFEMPGFKEKTGVVKDFIRMVAEEDRAMLDSLQNGVRSRNFRPGPTVALEEAIHHTLNYYLDRVFGEDAARL